MDRSDSGTVAPEPDATAPSGVPSVPPPWTSYAAQPTVVPETPAEQPALAIDADDRPVVAWSQRPKPNDRAALYIQRFNGETWGALSEPLAFDGARAGNADSPAVAVGPDGDIFVAFEARGVYLWRWDAETKTGQLSEPLPDSDGPGRDLTGNMTGFTRVHPFDSGPALALHPGTGLPVVSFSDHFEGIGGPVYVASLRESAWSTETVPGSHALTPPSLAFDALGRLYVAWSSPEGALRLARSDGAAWTQLDPVLPARYGKTYWPRLVAQEAQIVLSWEQTPSDATGPDYSEVGAAALTSESWSLLPLRTPEGAIRTLSHSRVLDRGGELLQAHFAWDPETPFTGLWTVSAWDGSEWRATTLPLSASLKDNGNGPPAIALDSAGHLVVAFKDSHGLLQVVRQD